MRRGLTILVLLLLLAGGGWWLRDRLAASQASHAAAQAQAGARRGGGGGIVTVVLAPVVARDVPVYLDGLGTVQAYNTVTVLSMITGPLSKVLFHQGQEVKAGDLLAQVDPRPYQAILDQAVAKKAQDTASLANARLDLARYEKLVKTNYTSAQIADTQRALVAQDVALVNQDQAQIDAARVNLGYTAITAPLDGRTGIRQVDPGNIVHTGDTTGIVVLTQLRPIYVLFTLPQQDLPAVQLALRAGPVPVLAVAQGSLPVNGASLDSGNGPGVDTSGGSTDTATDQPHAILLDTGQVAVLDNQVDSTTGTIRLRATFPNAQETLWPGAFVNARLLAQTLHGALTIPPVAVQRGPLGAYVYVVGQDHHAHRRSIVLGHEDEQNSVATSGLQAGEQVVIDGASRLSDDVVVRVATPNAAPDGAGTTPPSVRRSGETP